MKKSEKYEKAVFVDLDGTLLTDNHQISAENYDTLVRLGNKNILRVVVTGRSMYSVHKVLQPNFPIDFCIFSTGGGILDWKQNRIIKKYDLNRKDIDFISQFLIEKDLDFMLHFSIPENHKYYFNKSTKTDLNKDFEDRCELYDGFITSLDVENLPKTAAQFLVISDKHKDVKLYREIVKKLEKYTVILTTSPIDRVSTWIEIFPKTVSKGLASNFLIQNLEICQQNTMAIGNDYNDADLLDWANTSFVVDNAHTDLKAKHRNVPSNENNGFQHSVNFWLNKNNLLL